MADFYLSKDVSGTVVCGCSACSIADEIEVVFSGVGSSCYTCVTTPEEPNKYLDGTIAGINATHTLASITPPGGEDAAWSVSLGTWNWELNGNAYPACNDPAPITGTDAVEILLTCTAGVYFLFINAEWLSGTLQVFNGSSVALAAVTNTTGCAGSATLTEVP
jgi:hypothetical protein